MNQYGARVKLHWAHFLPEAYAEIRDPGSFFGVLGEQIALKIDELTGELAGDDPPGEGYLAKAERLTAARCQAEEIIMYEYGLLAIGDEDEDDEPAAARNRPVVVDRDHPSWEQVDAEQRERIGDPPGEDGTP